MAKTVLMEEMTWKEIKQDVESGKDTAILVAASIEQHGPHLPTATDTIIGYALAEAVAKKLGCALVAPVISARWPFSCRSMVSPHSPELHHHRGKFVRQDGFHQPCMRAYFFAFNLKLLNRRHKDERSRRRSAGSEEPARQATAGDYAFSP